MENQKNLFLAIIISMAIIFGFQLLVPQPERAPVTEETNTQESISLDIQGTTSTILLDRNQVLEETVRVTFDNSKIKGSINLEGGIIDDLVLEEYRETLDPTSDFIGFLNPRFWDKAIETTTMVVIGIAICIVIGIPIGIAMARSEKVRNAILPILDTMQVIPAFCYLIPGIILFGLGAIPAIISIFIYACPPLIRLTDLGIRLVDKEVIEAADAFGASRKQKLWGVQMPLALPNIMQGINQCTMMALSMVVIASMIGTRGLGDEVLLGLQQLNVGRAAEAGIAIVLLAIVLDRITQSYGETLQERRAPEKKKGK